MDSEHQPLRTVPVFLVAAQLKEAFSVKMINILLAHFLSVSRNMHYRDTSDNLLKPLLTSSQHWRAQQLLEVRGQASHSLRREHREDRIFYIPCPRSFRIIRVSSSIIELCVSSCVLQLLLYHHSHSSQDY